ncbi:SMP-30/gluconolactonase/LRE family protein [Lewinella sp. JB7]|uniref:SMP-30/gluconolactonase/LRE family protein n=1 Tax=Lewinella sp. JB7 TaxID=2962887 RepID=UPI0020C9482E|nr:SMP-30/gluconolactonase/LRE family protein [Lewinella sp. JB7]MCP9237759.1 SMP-30/gluconolactonase/LRE family protein [Lewinella sp. JB7]
MSRLLPLLVLVLSVGCRTKALPETLEPAPASLRIEAFDAAATRALFGDEPVIEVLFGGMDWSEGPLVLPNGEVICSDVPRNHIVQWTGDTSRVWLSASGTTDNAYSREPGSNGLALNAAGQLLLCQHGNRRVALMEAPLDDPRPRFRSLADRYEGKRFNSPNDLVVAADGSILFTDPPYGLPDDAERELDYCGVFRIDPRGRVTLLTKAYSRPNGIGLSPDGNTLYIGNSDGQRAVVTATPILDADFTLGEARTLIDATELAGTVPGSPDGLAVARDGRIYATSPGGVWVIRPDGTLLSKVRSDRPVSNVELSPGEDWLYLTNDDRLVRVKLNNL